MNENEHKHTPGPWGVAGGCHLVGANGQQIATFAKDDGMEAEMDANMRIVVDAGNIATETGLTPRQLAEHRSELIDACVGAVERHHTYTDESGFVCITLGDYAAILSAIAKATGKETDQ